jgi:ribose 5-phosphate isomerase B
MKIYLATDHAGFELKNKVADFLEKEGYAIEDCGPETYDKDDDYPDYISKAAAKVSENPEDFGIVFGGSGQGEAIVANKFKGVRCALFYGPVIPPIATDITGNKSDDPYEMLRLTREHNNSNMLSLGVRFLTEEDAFSAIKLFLTSKYSAEERHARRIEKIKKLEERQSRD